MSTVKADTVQPKDFEGDLTLGASGDTVTVAADSININKVQDKGGNTLWDYSTGAFVSTQPAFGSKNLKLLTTATLGGGGSISFISGIDSTYDVYIFKFFGVNPRDDGLNLLFQTSTDGGSSYGVTATTTYFAADHNESGSGGSLAYVASGDLAQSTSYQRLTQAIGNASDESAAGELYLFAPSSTTYVKHFYSRAQGYGAGNNADDCYAAGYFNTTSAINAIDFKMSSPIRFDATIKMYGLL